VGSWAGLFAPLRVFVLRSGNPASKPILAGDGMIPLTMPLQDNHVDRRDSTLLPKIIERVRSRCFGSYVGDFEVVN
jgi:hypothetical protein